MKPSVYAATPMEQALDNSSISIPSEYRLALDPTASGESVGPLTWGDEWARVATESMFRATKAAVHFTEELYAPYSGDKLVQPDELNAKYGHIPNVKFDKPEYESVAKTKAEAQSERTLTAE